MQFGDNFQYRDWEPIQPEVHYGQPVAAAAAVQPARTVFNARMFKIYGAVLALMAAATLALGIADVVMTMEAYCTPWSTASPLWCSTTAEPYIWTWVASGIWGSVPIFLAGLFAMCLSANPLKWTRVFALLIFLSAIVFAPAMVILSGIEIWRGHTSTYTFYKLNSTIGVGSILPATNPYQAKFAIPLAIAIIAAIMFIMTGIITMILCCCMHRIGIYLPTETEEPAPVQQTIIQQPTPAVVQTREIYYPSRPQIRSGPVVDPFTPLQANDPYSRFSALQQMPTRYNSVPNPYGSGVMYGNFPARPVEQPTSFASEFFKPNPAYFWK